MGFRMKPTDVRAMAPAMRFPVEERRTRVVERGEEENEDEGDVEEGEEKGRVGRAGVAKYGITDRRVRSEERV